MEQKLSREPKPKVWAEIDTSALVHNYRLIQRTLPRSCRQICVAKSDCYGHGAEACVAALEGAGADFFAVSSCEEAVELRRYTGRDILILSYTPPCDIGAVCENNFIQTVYSEEYARQLCEALAPSQRLRIHIKTDTGMNRIGFTPAQLDGIIRTVRMDCFCAEGLFTHFAKADESDLTHTKHQLARFDAMRRELATRGVVFPMHHAANSAAAQTMPDTRYDAVRSGISLYGLNPSPQTVIKGIKPVMTLKTTVVHTHIVHDGDTVSYGGNYTARGDRLIATLSAGYGDGVMRAYTGACVTVGTARAPIVGNVCMDHCMVDITGINGVKIGDEAVIFGNGGESVDAYAKTAGTINYECVCLITKRVKRIYK